VTNIANGTAIMADKIAEPKDRIIVLRNNLFK
jgi:hypothetical protein